ncbi:MAG: hypothetical protein Fur0016_32390 [Anaerolineales bacterium]
MTTIIEEGALQFSFDKRWNVIKYDEERDYREKIHKLKDTKAIDFLGTCENELYLLEIKDFRGHRIENQTRLTSEDLVIETAQKVRDTIAGTIGAYRTSSESQKWQEFVQYAANPERRIKVMLWLEYELPAHPKARAKVKASVLSQQLKKAVRWLTPYAFVAGMNHTALSAYGVSVSNLPK